MSETAILSLITHNLLLNRRKSKTGICTLFLDLIIFTGSACPSGGVWLRIGKFMVQNPETKVVDMRRLKITD